jgi:UDP-glucuronate 4-epimerase
MKMLLTGAAGFIGMHIALKLLERGDNVIGIDNINSYYDPELKKERLKLLQKYENFNFKKVDISDSDEIKNIFSEHKFDKVIHMAAQAGVRYSIDNPSEYIKSNIVGFANIIENCRYYDVEHLVYASSSSVYGNNTKIPFKEIHSVDHPISLYAATKKSNELHAHVYSHLYKLPTTGLRFFTVYGPWGRPDMALFKFTKNIIENKSIDVYNSGKMVRDFTYIDDIVEGVVKATDKVSYPSQKHDSANPNPSISNAPYRIFNIGCGKPTNLMNYIQAIEDSVGIKADINFLDMQPGDVLKTSSHNALLEDWINFTPSTSIDIGVKNFVDWYRSFYKI